jgi:ABC-2 type transport system ATP-binding protein
MRVQPTGLASDPIISVAGLSKSFGATPALVDLDLQIARGEVRALLGPNGAGKTTAVRILATLLRPDSGEVRIAGYDALAQQRKVQALIGLSGQSASADDKLTGRENLTMFARLQRLSKHDARARARQLLEEFGLDEVAGRAVKTYSGGTRRRLDLAVSLIVAPPIVFLDEPTSGLDPSARHTLWAAIRALVDRGTTVLLTTHDLDEADQLADVITIINKGRVIAEGTSAGLKAQVGGTRILITASTPEGLAQLASMLSERAPVADERTRTVSVAGNDDGAHGLRELGHLIDDIAASDVAIEDFAIRKPTLDDVFATLTEPDVAGAAPERVRHDGEERRVPTRGAACGVLGAERYLGACQTQSPPHTQRP